jgi:transposase
MDVIMPNPYSIDLRVRVVESVQNGMSYGEVSEVFQLGIASVKRWFYQFRDIGTVAPKTGYQKGHSHKIFDDISFVKLVTENPSMTSSEIAQILGNVSATTVRKKLKEIKFSRKKNLLVRRER